MNGSTSLCSISCESIYPAKLSYGALDSGKDIFDFIIKRTGIQTDRVVDIFTSQNTLMPVYLWTEEQNLIFAPEITVNDVKRNSDINIYKVVIPFENIIDFSQVGEMYREQVISGGGDNGVNYVGAVVGGLLFGAAGAIIGSRREVKEIKSETLEHDSRRTLLRYYYEGKETYCLFTYESYMLFEDLIPQFEKEAVKARKIQMADQTAEISRPQIAEQQLEDAFALIRRVKVLYDEGILTEEEFKAKKKEILDRI